MKQQFSKEGKERYANALVTASRFCGYSGWHGNSPFAQSQHPQPVLVLKQVRLGIVMGGMHFAAGMPVRNLRTRLQNGFADAPLGRRPALAHRGMVFEPLFCRSKRHCVRAWRSPKTAGALRTCADRHHLPHSFPCRKEVLQPIIISQDPVDHSPGRAHDLAGQQHDDVQKTPKLHFD